MIAANYRKHPEAAALQLPLPFPHRLRWATTRPGRRILRAIRAERLALIEQVGRIVYPIKPSIPQWWKDAKKRARNLARQVKDACIALVGEIRVADTNPPRLIGFNYAEPAWPFTDTPENIAKANATPYRTPLQRRYAAMAAHHRARLADLDREDDEHFKDVEDSKRH